MLNNIALVYVGLGNLSLAKHYLDRALAAEGAMAHDAARSNMLKVDFQLQIERAHSLTPSTAADDEAMHSK